MTGRKTTMDDGSQHSSVGHTVEIPSSVPFTPQVETPREQARIDPIEIQLLTPNSSTQMTPSSSTPSHQSSRNDKSGREENHGENDLHETSLSSYERQLLQLPLTEDLNKEYDKKESWNVP